MEKKAALMFHDRSLGEILRIKGFHFEDGKWYELNVSRSGTTIKECKSGQEVWIVIGEGLDQEAIQRRMKQIDEAAETISVDTDDGSPFDSV